MKWIRCTKIIAPFLKLVQKKFANMVWSEVKLKHTAVNWACSLLIASVKYCGVGWTGSWTASTQLETIGIPSCCCCGYICVCTWKVSTSTWRDCMCRRRRPWMGTSRVMGIWNIGIISSSVLISRWTTSLGSSVSVCNKFQFTARQKIVWICKQIFHIPF